jgi:hypothetical protein
MVQRLSAVGHQVHHVHKTHGQTKQTVVDAVALAFVGRVGRVTHAGRVLNQHFGVALTFLAMTVPSQIQGARGASPDAGPPGRLGEACRTLAPACVFS